MSQYTILILNLCILTLVSSMSLFHVRLIEQNDSRLIATSNYNYAIASPSLAVKNWRLVSVNGENVVLVTTTGQKLVTTKTALGAPDVQFIENLRDQLSNGQNGGYTHFSSSLSSGPIGTSSESSSSYSSSSTSSISSTMTSSTGGIKPSDMNLNMKDDNNFSVARSDLPLNWSQLFYNNDLVTIIYRDGEVKMLPLALLEPVELEAINKTKLEVKEMQKTQAQQISNTMQNSLNMMSNIFNNVLGNLPSPPNYKASIGNMFGDNFPFGNKNSPFSPEAGWPFAGGNGAFAGAIAG